MRFKLSLKSTTIVLRIVWFRCSGVFHCCYLVFRWHSGVFCWCSGLCSVFRHCSGVFRYSSGVPCSVVSCSGVPGFIVRRRKIALEFIFLVSQKFRIYKILNALNLFQFTIDSFVLVNEEVQFFFYDICHFLFVLLII